MLKVKALYKKFPNWELGYINLTYGHGVYGLTGPNGSGKTTLMTIMAGGDLPDKGDVMINRHSLRSKPDLVRKHIGYLPQAFQINEKLTGRAFLDQTAVLKGLKKRSERREWIEKVLKMCHLTDMTDRKIKTYSTGMVQRLGIAQALIGGPDVLILDEPTVGLDPLERVHFRQLIGHYGLSHTVIFSTHIVGDIMACCQECTLLINGHIAFNGNFRSLAHRAEGHVWSYETGQTPMDPQAIILSRSKSCYLCKIIGEEPTNQNARPLTPTAVDGYLSVLRGY